MTLKEYHRKRDFKKTAEPRGSKRVPKGWLYAIQKHDASHLHYDFRLQLGDVLLSWAVPKGPCLDPSVKRLAMHVEDHPVDYGGFEGTIPEGQYGGGTVMLWDTGHWEPVGDAKRDYAEGRLKFHLFGKKLRGGWMLVRRGGKHDPNERAWFLFKERDDEARELDDYDITVEEPLSVKTGRDLEEIGTRSRKVWQSNRETTKNGKAMKSKSATKRKTTTAKTAKRSTTRAKRKTSKRSGGKRSSRRSEADDIAGSRRASLPRFVKPQLATLTDEAPEGAEWLHEIKFDGYRMLCRIDHGEVKFISRNDQDWTSKFGKLVEAAAELPVDTALLDGEVVVIETDGTTSFQALQNAFKQGRGDSLVYYAFDLLHLDGWDVTGASLEGRKQLLAEVVTQSKRGPIRFSEHAEASGSEFFKAACKSHLEGIISKRRDVPYASGRGYDWLKVKCLGREEFVIGGFTSPSGSRTGFGALLIGTHDRSGELLYAGKVGTGFDDRTLRELHAKLKRIERKSSPFANLQGTTGEARGAHWVDPKLVAQIEFTEWTGDRRLRHPSFQGLRQDKPASKVTRDEKTPVASAVEASHEEETSVAAKRAKRTISTSNGAIKDTTILGVTVTHPDKVLYPDQKVTKLQLAEYYEAIAKWMMPQVKGRPAVLVRCPEGQKKTCFYQKHPGKGLPIEMRQIPIREKDSTGDYVVLEKPADLVAMAQMGVLEIHVWGSMADTLERPDRLVFDLDPDPTVHWPQVVEATKEIRKFLEDLGLTSFLKTTGGKGLHLVVPIARRTEWDDAKDFCRAVAEAIVRAAPDRYTSNMSKAQRKGKIFLDYLRNGRGATAVAPYSTRARDGATVSTPIAWRELTDKLNPRDFTILTVPARMKRLKADPWHDIDEVRQSITSTMRKRLHSPG